MENTMYEYVMQRLDMSRGHWRTVAERSGVSYRTLQKIATKLIADPGVSHIQKLCDYFKFVDQNQPPPPKPPVWPGV